MSLIKRGRINNINATLMISVALLIDFVIFVVGIIGFIPILGPLVYVFILFIINVYAKLIFLTWFMILGVGIFRKPGRAAAMFGAFIISFVPLLSLLPAWTASVFLVILTTRAKPVRPVTKYKAV